MGTGSGHAPSPPKNSPSPPNLSPHPAVGSHAPAPPQPQQRVAARQQSGGDVLIQLAVNLFHAHQQLPAGGICSSPGTLAAPSCPRRRGPRGPAAPPGRPHAGLGHGTGTPGDPRSTPRRSGTTGMGTGLFHAPLGDLSLRWRNQKRGIWGLGSPKPPGQRPARPRHRFRVNFGDNLGIFPLPQLLWPKRERTG